MIYKIKINTSSYNMYCGQCGNLVENGTLVCPFCGAWLPLETEQITNTPITETPSSSSPPSPSYSPSPSYAPSSAFSQSSSASLPTYGSKDNPRCPYCYSIAPKRKLFSTCVFLFSLCCTGCCVGIIVAPIYYALFHNKFKCRECKRTFKI